MILFKLLMIIPYIPSVMFKCILHLGSVENFLGLVFVSTSIFLSARGGIRMVQLYTTPESFSRSKDVVLNFWLLLYLSIFSADCLKFTICSNSNYRAVLGPMYLVVPNFIIADNHSTSRSLPNSQQSTTGLYYEPHYSCQKFSIRFM